MGILGRVRSAFARSPDQDPVGERTIESGLDLPLGALLSHLRDRSTGARPPRAVVEWARDVLDLRGQRLEDWCSRVSWGRAATSAVRRRIRQGRVDEIRERIEPFDVEAIRERRGERGLILVGAHLGPPCVLRMAIADAGIPLLALTAYEGDEQFADEKIAVVDDARRRTCLLAARARLEAGGVVHTAADGRHGRRSVVLPILGRQVELCVGLPNLVRITRAPAVTAAALWVGDRIRIEIGPRLPLPDDGEEAGAFVWRWLAEWARWFEGHVRNDPDNLRLRGGLLRPGVGGIL